MKTKMASRNRDRLYVSPFIYSASQIRVICEGEFPKTWSKKVLIVYIFFDQVNYNSKLST